MAQLDRELELAPLELQGLGRPPGWHSALHTLPARRRLQRS
ncbi:hypothetical protein ACH4E8_20645 [Streptomyces sp. NPDC017979]